MSTQAPAAPADHVYAEAVELLKGVIPNAKIEEINLDDIYVDKTDNVRHSSSYKEDEILALAEDIRNVGGLLQPIGVYRIAESDDTLNKPFALAYGFRRTLAYLRLAEVDPERWAKLPAVVLETVQDKGTLTMIQLMENLSRKNLTPMEKAVSIKTALDDGEANLKQQDVAKALNMPVSAVSQHLRLLELPNEFQEAIQDGRMKFSNARTLIYAELPAEKLKDFFKEACEDSKEEFEGKINRYKNSLGQQTSGNAAGGTSSTQRGKQTLRAGELTRAYVPFLKQKLSQVKDDGEKKYTAADVVAAQLDAINTVLTEGETNLAKDIKPFIAELEAKEKEEEAQEESQKAEAKFWLERCKDVDAIIDAPLDPKDPNAQRPSIGTAYVSVVKKAYADRAAGKLKDAGFDLPMGTEGDDKAKTAAGMKLAVERLMNTYAEREADKEKRKKAAKEAKAKKDAEKAKEEASKKAADANAEIASNQEVGDGKTDE